MKRFLTITRTGLNGPDILATSWDHAEREAKEHGVKVVGIKKGEYQTEAAARYVCQDKNNRIKH